MKRFFASALAAILLIGWLPCASRAVGTSAASAVLMDASSGRVLYEQNAHQPRLIASITKLMTALVALESGHSLEEQVTILPEYTQAEGSSIYLKAGETVSLEVLLYGLMLQSGNDAALAVAGWCGGSVEQFVAQMNKKARQLGMKNSHFANPNGLNAEDHYSTAYDMALLARACLECRELAQIVATRSISMEGRSFANHNKLLWRYQGCIGLKTGYTEKAGRTLVSAAERDGMTLIAVTLNDPDDWRDHTALLDYGFSTFRLQQGAQAGEAITKLPVSGGLVLFVPVAPQRDMCAALAQGETLEQELRLTTDHLTAPVEAGQPVGTLVYRIGDQVLDEVPLVCGVGAADCTAEELSLWQRLTGWLRP
ncbi:MAG: D-alanyl-D-alanine carboxypeptidase [Clostridium sp.]|nr:D-alanyl-D-alanine carboxypeptidase [Clostridium sp.]